MIDKKIIIGILIGLGLGITPLAFSNYEGDTKATDLSAGELKEVITDALSECTVTKQAVTYATNKTKFQIDC